MYALCEMLLRDWLDPIKAPIGSLAIVLKLGSTSCLCFGQFFYDNSLQLTTPKSKEDALKMNDYEMKLLEVKT